MAELNKAELQAAVAAYADPSKSHATTYTASVNAVTGMLNQIGANHQIRGTYKNRWRRFYRGKMSQGQDVQLWFKPLVKPVAYDGLVDQTAEATNIKVCYTYPVGEQRYKATKDEIEILRALQDPAQMAELVSSLAISLDDSVNTFEDGTITQTLAEWRDIAAGAGGPAATQVVVQATATDAATATAYIKKIKSILRGFREPLSKYNKSGVLTASGDAVTLVIRGDVADCISVDAIAGAINAEKLAFNVEIVEVDAFTKADGTTASDITAIVMDDQVLGIYDVVDYYNEADISGTHKRNYYRYRDINIAIAYPANIVYVVPA